jgi:hypothetical protein
MGHGTKFTPGKNNLGAKVLNGALRLKTSISIPIRVV